MGSDVLKGNRFNKIYFVEICTARIRLNIHNSHSLWMFSHIVIFTLMILMII